MGKRRSPYHPERSAAGSEDPAELPKTTQRDFLVFAARNHRLALAGARFIVSASENLRD